MDKDVVFLSICIPTYLRPAKLRKQLAFLIAETHSLPKDENLDFEILVRDNATPNISIDEIRSEFSGYSFLRVNKNDSNVGLEGNLKLLMNDAVGEYIWFVGDDDELLPGILCAVLNALRLRPNFLMLNHSAVDDNNIVRMHTAFPSKTEFDVIDVLNASRTTIMFITACIYRVSTLAEANRLDKDFNITAPLYWSLFCGLSGRAVFLDKIYVINYWGEVSWASKSTDIFNRLVPQQLEKIIRIYPSNRKLRIAKTKYVLWRQAVKLKSAIRRKLRAHG